MSTDVGQTTPQGEPRLASNSLGRFHTTLASRRWLAATGAMDDRAKQAEPPRAGHAIDLPQAAPVTKAERGRRFSWVTFFAFGVALLVRGRFIARQRAVRRQPIARR